MLPPAILHYPIPLFQLIEYIHNVLQVFLIGKGDADFSLACGRACHLDLRVEEIGEALLQVVELLRQVCLCLKVLLRRLDILTIVELLTQLLHLADGVSILLYLVEELELQRGRVEGEKGTGMSHVNLLFL